MEKSWGKEWKNNGKTTRKAWKNRGESILGKSGFPAFGIGSCTGFSLIFWDVIFPDFLEWNFPWFFWNGIFPLLEVKGSKVQS